MAPTGGLEAFVGVSGFSSSIGGYTVNRDRVARVQLPDSLSEEDLDTVVSDLDLLRELVVSRRSDFLALNRAVLHQDIPEALDIATRVGLDEATFASRRGGVWGLVVVIAIAAAVLLESDTPPPPPPPPPPDAGAPDAGPG